MATATAPDRVNTTALTEADFRAAIREGEHRIAIEGRLDLNEGNVFDLLDPFLDSEHALPDGSWDDFTPGDDHPGTLWADMRPTESEELLTRIEEIVVEVERAAATMLEEKVTAFAVDFAARHPNIPRGTWRAKVSS